MKLTQQQISDVSEVEVSFFTSQLECHPWENHDDLLVISFKSQKAVNSRDLCFMDAMKSAASVVWRPAAIILDFRELHYIYGDTMDCLFQSLYPKPSTQLEKIFAGPEERFPIVAVKSPLNQEGLTSLVRKEMSRDPVRVLFESLEEEVKAIEAELKDGEKGVKS